MSKQVLKDTVGWGFGLWLIGYALGFVFFAFVPAGMIGWVIMAIGAGITLWVAFKKVAGASMRYWCRSPRLLREDRGKHDVGGEDAAVVVPALGDDDRAGLGAERLREVRDERFAARAARRPLRHRDRRGVEPTERQHVHLAEQVRRRPLRELFAKLIVRHLRGVAGAIVQPGGPAVVVGSLRGVG